jgi:hypothetical protein
VNIAALLGTSGIMPEQLGTNTPVEETDVDFKQMLQTLVTSSDLELDETADEAPNWLGFLLKYFDTSKMASTTTPDSTGEALKTTDSEPQVSLTELMAVLHPLVTACDSTSQQLDLSAESSEESDRAVSEATVPDITGATTTAAPLSAPLAASGPVNAGLARRRTSINH